MSAEQEAERIERWHIDQFFGLGFEWGQVSTLVSWGCDPHEAERLMRRDGKPTACTPEQALRILQPLDDVAVLVADSELALV